MPLNRFNTTPEDRYQRGRTLGSFAQPGTRTNPLAGQPINPPGTTSPSFTINAPGTTGGSVGGAGAGFGPTAGFTGARGHTQTPATAITNGAPSGRLVSGGSNGGDDWVPNSLARRNQRLAGDSTYQSQVSTLNQLFKQDPAAALTMMRGSGNFSDLQRHLTSSQFGGDTNAMNQWINSTHYGGTSGYAYDPATGRITSGWGQNEIMPSSAGAPGPLSGAVTRGAAGAATGSGPAGAAPSSDVGYGFDVNQYLDPSMRFQMGEGMRALEGSAAGRGSLQSGDTLRDIVNYSQGVAGTDWNNAFGRASGVRDFNYGMDRDDRNFDYGAARDDRNFDYNRQRDLASMGLGATGTQQGGQNALAGILAGLLGNRGQIEGSGAIGQGNAVNGSISQIINYLMNQQMVNSLGRK